MNSEYTLGAFQVFGVWRIMRVHRSGRFDFLSAGIGQEVVSEKPFLARLANVRFGKFREAELFELNTTRYLCTLNDLVKEEGYPVLEDGPSPAFDSAFRKIQELLRTSALEIEAAQEQETTGEGGVEI